MHWRLDTSNVQHDKRVVGHGEPVEPLRAKAFPRALRHAQDDPARAMLILIGLRCKVSVDTWMGAIQHDKRVLGHGEPVEPLRAKAFPRALRNAHHDPARALLILIGLR